MGERMQTIANSFADLAPFFGLNQSKSSTAIPEWEERYIKRIEQMFNAVKEITRPVWDWGWESFIFERPTPRGYNLRRLLWSEGEQWVFGDEDGHEYAISSDLSVIVERIKKWSNAKFIKK